MLSSNESMRHIAEEIQQLIELKRQIAEQIGREPDSALLVVDSMEKAELKAAGINDVRFKIIETVTMETLDESP